jgi:hypothetical protein
MAGRHGVTAEQADEAPADPDALVFDPDYASQSGRSVRTIGWSGSAGRLLTVITVTEDDVTYGSTAGRPMTPMPATTETPSRPSSQETAMTRNNDDELRRLLDEEAEHAEATKDDPIPASALARATRPNRGKSVMFSLRLNPDELAAVQALAEDQGVPASTLVRGWIVRQLAAERVGAADTDAALDRLETDVRALRKLLVS